MNKEVVIDKCKAYIQKNLTVFVFYGVLFMFYISLCNFSTAATIIVFFISYSSAMTANRYGRIKLIKCERAGTLNMKRRLIFTHLSLFPIYFIWILTALVAQDLSGAWMAISLPIVLISIMSISILLDLFWERSKRYMFWLCQLGAYAICFFIGFGLAQLVS